MVRIVNYVSLEPIKKLLLPLVAQNVNVMDMGMNNEGYVTIKRDHVSV